MTQSPFRRMYSAIEDAEALRSAYEGVLQELFKNPLWAGGPVEFSRVPWVLARQARIDDNRAFESPGLYLWGSETYPLYVGMTGKSFGKRFSRYIWSKRSQCNLAQQFEATLISNGIDGFPVEVREYARESLGSEVRLHGAVRFAKVRIANVWFALFPHDNLDEIERLERALIPVASQWNNDRAPPDFRPLLNLEFNRRGGKPNLPLNPDRSPPTEVIQ